MSSETALTGRLGKFVVESTLIARATQWQVSPNLATKAEWGDSDSGGYTNRAAGRRDATFQAEGKYDTEDEVFDIFMPEDISVVTLFMSTVGPLYWDFPRALCSDFSMSVDIDTEEVVGWTSGWGADGIYYRPGQSGVASRTVPS